MAYETRPSPAARRRAVREVVVYGVVGVLSIALLKLVEARFLAGESTFGVYAECMIERARRAGAGPEAAT